jgi:hypothetical protein
MHSSRQQRSSATDLVRREIRAIIFEYARDKTFGWTEINNVSDIESPTAATSTPSLSLARERGPGASSSIQDVEHTAQSVAIKIAIQPDKATVSKFDDKQTGTLQTLAEPMVASRARSNFASSPNHPFRASRRQVNS